MRLRLVFAGLSCAMSVACGGKVIFENTSSTGGAGGHLSTTTTHAATSTSTKATTAVSVGTTTTNVSVGTTVNSAVSVSAVTTGASMCDTGQLGGFGPICDNCASCAEGNTCAMSLQILENDPDGAQLLNCFQSCPQNSQACYTSCQNAHPQGNQLYYKLYDCIVCNACPQNCNAAQNCGTFGG